MRFIIGCVLCFIGSEGVAHACDLPHQCPETELRNSFRFGMDFAGGWWTGGGSLEAKTDSGKPVPNGAHGLWRWSDGIDLSYAHGDLVFPIIGGFLGQAGGGVNGGTAFGLYGGALLPGIGTRTPLSNGWVLEATVRGVYSFYSLESMGGGQFNKLSGGGLSARADVRTCSNQRGMIGLDWCFFVSPNLYEGGVMTGANAGLSMVM